MQIMAHLSIFALGVILGTVLTFKFRKPTTVNEYSGTVKNKIRGRNNEQINDNRADLKSVLTSSMSRREARRTAIEYWKSLKSK